jgi:hypothetical protein
MWRFFFALAVPVIGLLAGGAFVVFGPLSWWASYLLVGTIWGITRPARQIFRNAMKFIGHKFRSAKDSRWTCVKEEMMQEIDDWRREPLMSFGVYVGISVVMVVSWPLAVLVGAYVKASLDHG